MNCGSGESLNVSIWCGLSAERPPDPADRALAHPGRGRHRARRPVRRVRRLLLERLHDHPLDVLVADRARLARPRLVMQPIEAAPREPAPPPADRRAGYSPTRPRSPCSTCPSAAANTIRQRNASACELFGRRAHRSSVSRSSSLSTTSARCAMTAPNRRSMRTTFDGQTPGPCELTTQVTRRGRAAAPRRPARSARPRGGSRRTPAAAAERRGERGELVVGVRRLAQADVAERRSPLEVVHAATIRRQLDAVPRLVAEVEARAASSGSTEPSRSASSPSSRALLEDPDRAEPVAERATRSTKVATGRAGRAASFGANGSRPDAAPPSGGTGPRPAGGSRSCSARRCRSALRRSGGSRPASCPAG